MLAVLLEPLSSELRRERVRDDDRRRGIAVGCRRSDDERDV